MIATVHGSSRTTQAAASGYPRQPETTVLYETQQRVYELHWMRHADRYLALVRAALARDPHDLELLELLQAMEAAMAAKQNRPLH